MPGNTIMDAVVLYLETKAIEKMTGTVTGKKIFKIVSTCFMGTHVTLLCIRLRGQKMLEKWCKIKV